MHARAVLLCCSSNVVAVCNIRIKLKLPVLACLKQSGATSAALIVLLDTAAACVTTIRASMVHVLRYMAQSAHVRRNLGTECYCCPDRIRARSLHRQAHAICVARA